MMRIVVMGAGGVGGYFGGKLAQAGKDVTLVARGAHLDAIRRQGLCIRSTIEGEWLAKPGALADLTGHAPADLVLICVKGFDTKAALETVRPVVGPETAVLTLQNGLDGPEHIEAAFGPGHALGGAAYVFATIDAPGVIAHRTLGRIAFGELDGQVTPRAEAIRDAFARARVPVELSTDIRRVLWEKYIMICAQAGMTALTRANAGTLRRVPECWTMYRRLVEELTALGRRAGVGLPADQVDRVLAVAENLAPEATSSLHHDLVHGRRLEIEALHGHAVRLGERWGVPTPMLFAVYAALKPHAGGASAAEESRA